MTTHGEKTTASGGSDSFPGPDPRPPAPETVSEASRVAEESRLAEDAGRVRNWKRWGPYLPERQWGTVREDYSPYGSCWEYFPHDHARSRAYRWGEDGLLGWCDRECRLCFSLALWNGNDPILKERLFGLTNDEGNHGEDVKECYYYLDGTPTHSYQRALYKYPQAEFPYSRLREENRRRGKYDREFELADTGVFDENRYFDIQVEYAKAGPDDILIRITAANRGPDTATLDLLPMIWFRNTWAWGRVGEDFAGRPRIARDGDGVVASHPTLHVFRLAVKRPAPWLFTENETNFARLYGYANSSPAVKDAFHEFVVNGRADAVSPNGMGTKAAAHYRAEIAGGAEFTVELRLFSESEAPEEAFGPGFDRVFEDRIREMDEFYTARLPRGLSAEERRVARQAYAGLLWSKQYYEYVTKEWLAGDPGQPPPPAGREKGRNSGWTNLHCRDVLVMPDKWEYPWFAAWDHAFQMVAIAQIDEQLAKDQLLLLLREWYMHPNGQLPAHEFGFSDVNPPVHAWACWRVYNLGKARGERDQLFLERTMHKLLLNFTWWVNRKDPSGRNLFAGGFLGLDNVALFDRGAALPEGVTYAQADGTAWMAFYCLTMLAMALELAHCDPAYEDIASKFFEHFVAITDAMNSLGGGGLWDDQDGFYYDKIVIFGDPHRMLTRSIVGLVPLFAVGVLEESVLDALPGFRKRMRWFLDNRPDLGPQIGRASEGKRLLSIPTRENLERVLRYALNEEEFLSRYGVRSLSRYYLDHPFTARTRWGVFGIEYDPGESTTTLFGGNSNWRGPVWFPINYLLVESLEKYHEYYGESFQVECPVGSGRMMNLKQVAAELSGRLTRIFLPDESGRRPCHGEEERYAADEHWRDLVLFYEHFHGDNGRGVGASHQTGWTAVVADLLKAGVGG
ncbi:MAG TPA: hypothetical protein VKU19_09255 [Bryobacteraceae bacterium]|nr:hypothetical protein [Bryobacteraceae bacterium]